jgi:hypothetical protein
MVDLGWKRAFDDPIVLSRGRQLITLEDAGNYITKLPKAEHLTPEWQDAMQILMLVASPRADGQRCWHGSAYCGLSTALKRASSAIGRTRTRES